MANSTKNLLAKLIIVSGLDAALARMAAQKKGWDAELAKKAGILKQKRDENDKRTRLVADKNAVCKKEERRLKDERTKLNERRHALSTLNNYKLQQAAEREIDHALRQLGGQEELLVSALEEAEKIEKEIGDLGGSISALEQDIQKYEAELKENIIALEERQRVAQGERDELTKDMDSGQLMLYDRVRGRYATDPLAMVKNNTCSGCFMAIVPQMIVEIAKGESLVRCRGCGRILYLEEVKEEQRK